GDRRPTPIDVSRRTAYIGAAVITGLIIFALWLVPNVVTIAIGGAAFALLLSYPVRVLDNYMPRQLAVLLTILGAVGVLAIAGMIVVPPIATQVTEFVEDLPGIVTDAEERLRAEALRLEEEGLLPADTEQRIG